MHGIPAAEEYPYHQEASQPPLYYLLSAGLVRLLGLHADDAVSFWRFNPWVACGPDAPALYDNRAILYHDPNREAFPWQGTLLMLHTLRIWRDGLSVWRSITLGLLVGLAGLSKLTGDSMTTPLRSYRCWQ